MNREQQRAKVRQLRKAGFSTEQASEFLKVYKETLENLDKTQTLEEGTKVKINLRSIQSHPDYDRYTEKYRKWIFSNTDKIYTVQYDKRHTTKPAVVCLKEDDSDPKWLFWTGDLIIQD